MFEDPTAWVQAIPLVMIFFVFYFVVIRPGRRREKARWTAVQALNGGETVVLTSGTLGTVAGVLPEHIEVDVAEGVRLRVLEFGIREVRPTPAPKAAVEVVAGEEPATEGVEAAVEPEVVTEKIVD